MIISSNYKCIYYIYLTNISIAYPHMHTNHSFSNDFLYTVKSMLLTGDICRRLIPSWAVDGHYDSHDCKTPVYLTRANLEVKNGYYINFYHAHSTTLTEHGLLFIHNGQLYHLHKNISSPSHFMNVGPSHIERYEVIDEVPDYIRDDVESLTLPPGVICRTTWKQVVKVYTMNGNNYIIPFVRTTKCDKQIVSLFNKYYLVK